jgi:hypothetical protein
MRLVHVLVHRLALLLVLGNLLPKNRPNGQPSTYGNLALLNSTKMKYNTTSMVDPMKASATHV